MSYQKIHAFGLDISDYSVKIVFLNKKRKVEVCLREKLPVGVVVNGKIKDKQILSETISQLKTKAGSALPTDKVILSLPESKVFAHVFNIPASLVNNPKVILKIAQENIPLNLNESIFDYKLLKDKDLPRKEKRIYFVAVEEKLVFDYLEVLTLAKLKPIAIDIEPSSIARALEDPTKQALQKKLLAKLSKKKKVKTKKEKNKKEQGVKKTETEKEKEETASIDALIKETLPLAEIVLDIGAKHSVATIFCNANVFPSISIPIGGQTFTQIIQEILKISDYEEAQKFKTKLTLKSEEYQSLRTSFEAEYDKLIKEVQSLIEYFEKNNEVVVNKLYLSGGGTKLNGLFEYIEGNLKLEVHKAEPQVELQKDCEEEFFVNAIGLALRGISGDPVTGEVNLLPAHQRRLLVEQQAKNAIIVSSLVVLFVSSLLIASFNIVLSNLYFDLEGLDKANSSFQKIIEGKRYQEIQAHIQNLNDSAQLAKQTLSETYSIQEAYAHFYANLPNAIVINQFNYDNKEGVHKIEVNGFSLTRDKVLTLQETLQNTLFYHNLVAPLSNLLKQNDIYFAFTFDLDFVEFQKYLAEEKQKAIEEAKKAREEASSATGSEVLHGTADPNQTFVGAFKTGTGANVKIPHTQDVKSNDATQTGTIIPLNEKLLNQENLESLNEDVGQISGNIETTENIEDQQIEEVLKNSNNEYPFQEKIHEKVGDIFVIEQKFLPGNSTGATNN